MLSDIEKLFVDAFITGQSKLQKHESLDIRDTSEIDEVISIFVKIVRSLLGKVAITIVINREDDRYVHLHSSPDSVFLFSITPCRDSKSIYPCHVSYGDRKTDGDCNDKQALIDEIVCALQGPLMSGIFRKHILEQMKDE